MKNNWIKVEDYLPHCTNKLDGINSAKVLVIDNGNKTIAFFCYDEYENYWLTEDGWRLYDITHWQYLPEDPVD